MATWGDQTCQRFETTAVGLKVRHSSYHAPNNQKIPDKDQPRDSLYRRKGWANQGIPDKEEKVGSTNIFVVKK